MDLQKKLEPLMVQRKVSYSDLILQILDINLDSFEFNIAT